MPVDVPERLVGGMRVVIRAREQSVVNETLLSVDEEEDVVDFLRGVLAVTISRPTPNPTSEVPGSTNHAAEEL